MIKRGLEQKNCTVKKLHEFAMKNASCVNGTIEIALERIQCDIAANSRRQNRGEFALCVSRYLKKRQNHFQIKNKINISEGSCSCESVVAFQYFQKL